MTVSLSGRSAPPCFVHYSSEAPACLTHTEGQGRSSRAFYKRMSYCKISPAPLRLPGVQINLIKVADKHRISFAEMADTNEQPLS